MNIPFKNEFLYISDSYKVSHHFQYPKKLSKLYSYFEARGYDSALFASEPEIVFFGLQYLLKKIEGVMITQEAIDEARDYYKSHFMGHDLFNYDGFKYVVDKHGGKLPIRIKAIPEGTVMSLQNVMMTVENTDSEMGEDAAAWLTNYVETYLTHIWHSITVATLARECKKIIYDACVVTMGDVDSIKIHSRYALHDFGMRGATCDEAAAVAGAAQQVSLYGTDTTSALRFIDSVYGGIGDGVAGHSVIASEHSVMTMYGKMEELDVVKHIITSSPENSIISLVADSYDVYNFTEQYIGTDLKDMILNGTKKIVIRPDSGDPITVITKLLEILESKFDIAYNNTGYKVLPKNIGLIWGDGINITDVQNILNSLIKNGWCVSNIVFGMGGGLHQKVNRDTLKFAFKACYAEFSDGTSKDIQKNPITDTGKRSKKGMLKLIEVDGNLITASSSTTPDLYYNNDDVLETVFENGEIKRIEDFITIRERAELK